MDKKVVPVFMPSLFRLFREAERKSGAPLSRRDAKEIRAKAVATFVTENFAAELEQRRGFRDLDPHDSWNDWQARSARFETC
jgi:hypothetical protein